MVLPVSQTPHCHHWLPLNINFHWNRSTFIFVEILVVWKVCIFWWPFWKWWPYLFSMIAMGFWPKTILGSQFSFRSKHLKIFSFFGGPFWKSIYALCHLTNDESELYLFMRIFILWLQAKTYTPFQTVVTKRMPHARHKIKNQK